MYQIPSAYLSYYRDFINRNARQFKLECTIKSNTSTVEISESDIASFSIDYDLLSGDEEYTVGNLASSKLTMTVSSKILIFETNVINLTIKLRAEDVHQREIWIPVPVGRFYVSNVSSTTLSKTIEAYDDLYKAELEHSYNSKLQYPTTVHQMIKELCAVLNIGYDESSIPNDTIIRPSVVVDVIENSEGKYEVVETDSNQVCLGLKVGQSLSCIAAYLGGNFFLDGDLKLKFVKYPSSIAKSYDFTKFAMPTYGSAMYSMKRMTCTGYTDNVIEAKIDNDAGSAMVLSSPFINKARLMQLLDELSNISYRQANVRVKGDPTLQVGDLIELYEISDSGAIVNRTQVPILRMTFNYSGGCTNTIDSPCKTNTEKSINYKGTISSRLDGLENTVNSTSSEVEKLNNSLVALNTIKDTIDTMDLFINSLPTELNDNKLSQYNLILSQIEQSDADFEKEYKLVYGSKYLQ
jgi:hypothetical protein